MIFMNLTLVCILFHSFFFYSSRFETKLFFCECLFCCEYPQSETNTWRRIDTPVQHQPPPRFGHGAAVLDKKMYIFGGKTKDGQVLSDLYVFDTQLNTWTQIIASYGFVPIGIIISDSHKLFFSLLKFATFYLTFDKSTS